MKPRMTVLALGALLFGFAVAAHAETNRGFDYNCCTPDGSAEAPDLNEYYHPMDTAKPGWMTMSGGSEFRSLKGFDDATATMNDPNPNGPRRSEVYQAKDSSKPGWLTMRGGTGLGETVLTAK